MNRVVADVVVIDVVDVSRFAVYVCWFFCNSSCLPLNDENDDDDDDDDNDDDDEGDKIANVDGPLDFLPYGIELWSHLDH